MKADALAPHQVMALSRTLNVCPDPVRLYAACCDDGRRRDTLLLESADQSTASGEKSLVLTRAALRLCCHHNQVEVVALSPNGKSTLPRLRDALSPNADVELSEDRLVAIFPPATTMGSERERLAAPSVLDVVRAAVLGLELVGGETALPPLVAGSLAYDLLGVYEKLPDTQRDEVGWPDYELWLAEELVWIEHAARRCTILRFVFGGDNALAAYHDAAAAMADMVACCQQLGSAPKAAPAPERVRPSLDTDTDVDVDVDDDAFAAAVVELKEHIVQGNVFQIVPSRTFSAACPDPLRAYSELRTLNPSPYMFFVSGSAGALFGASPESALTVVDAPNGTKRVTINPIAGTRPRGRSADGSIDIDLDGRLEAELRLDRKELAEHMMLVDLARNDVARVSRAGTRAVDTLLDVVRYSHVMHMVSLVSGELKAELDALHAYVATMNMGTLVGAPKLKAAELLRRYEPTRRGAYGGAVGYLSADGQLDSCIVIRSAVVTNGVARVRAGCGVVYDSDPQAEADETRRKAEAVLLALERASAEGATP